MRFAAPVWAALALTAGCVRFGYGSHPRKVDAGVDAGIVQPDSSVVDSGSAAGSGGTTAAGRGGTGGAAGSMGPRAGGGGSGGSAPDAGPLWDASVFDAGGTDSGPIDAGAPDSGAPDSGPTDSGAKDSGRDTGTTDPGTTDPVDPRWTEDCPGAPGVLFCDDFEDGLAKWSYPVERNGTSAASTTQKHAGAYSLRANTSASSSSSQSQARQAVKVFGHRKTGDLWARYFYYLPSSVTLTQKFSVGVISEYEEPWFGFSVLIFPDGIGLENGLTSRRVNTSFPRNQWVCIEMHVKIDATNGAFDFYMNGNKITSILGDTLPDQGYTTFEVGVHYADFNQGAITTYTDDVKLGTSRLGCN